MAHGLPILVTGFSVQQVIILSIGPALATETDARTGFWEFLHSWGGTWMWEVIEPGKDTPADVSWIVNGLRNGALIWTTDGSYDRKKAVNLCGVGWMIFCTNTGFRLTGTFWERSPLAISYRTKLLGLCTLHLFAQALAEFYKVIGWTAMLCCDNKRALGGVLSPHAPHLTKCKMRQHAPKSLGDHTATQWHFSLCSRLWTYGPYAQVGATHINPATQLCMQHTGKTLGHHSNKPWLS